MSNAERQADEWEALQAVYGDEEEDDVLQKVADNHWKIKLSRESVTGQQSNSISSADTVTLIIQLPIDYPSSQPPVVQIKAPQWVIDDALLKQWQSELVDLWSPDLEAGIVIIEHIKGLLMDQFEMGGNGGLSNAEDAVGIQLDQEVPVAPNNSKKSKATTRTFVPPSSKFHQPNRVFDTAVIDSEQYAATIHAGIPFHPPKSGPAELLQAFVAKVTSMEQVEWTLANLLMENKKVAKASHNMMAYRFFQRTADATGEEEGDSKDNNTKRQQLLLVSDHDDDGEKGSGAKLASLLELTDARNVIVIVSRWYGGIHLGSARFKWIASVGRDALDEFGFLTTTKSKK